MHLLPPSAPLDSFFAPVRRRHPDVDIVLLPGPEPRSTAEPVGDDQLTATLDRVTDAARSASAAALPTAQPPVPRWSFGPAEGSVTASARSAVTTPDGFGALVGVRAWLEAEGWRTRAPADPVDRVLGARDDVRVRASYAGGTGTFLLEVTSQPSYVGKARARRLVRQ